MIFCGNDTILVEMALESNSYWYIFILKTLLTSICLAVGFRGGNIGPAFIAGTTFGILISSLMGLDPLVGAAIGSVDIQRRLQSHPKALKQVLNACCAAEAIMMTQLNAVSLTVAVTRQRR